MLLITQKKFDGIGQPFTRHTEWHVGQLLVSRPRPKTEPQPLIDYNDVSTITEIQADGDELYKILLSFDCLVRPVTGKPVVRWFGDTARFIVANLWDGE